MNLKLVPFPEQGHSLCTARYRIGQVAVEKACLSELPENALTYGFKAIPDGNPQARE